MKWILFCQNPYAFGILEPIMQVLKEKNHDYIWYITSSLLSKFPFPSEAHTTSIAKLESYRSDAIICPGNEVPHFLRGLKVQVFHGLAGEKKGHFRIRHYFDLYLTQGPYFTKRFEELKFKHRDFEVIETGWPKLDIYVKNHELIQQEKGELLQQSQASKVVLYAPTFSPSLTSAPFLIEEIKELASNGKYVVLVKFHDLMDKQVINDYLNLARFHANVIVKEEPNIVKFLLMADILVSDTSSVVYEFLLLDKPVITFKNNSESILWDDSKKYKNLVEKVESNLNQDEFGDQRRKIIQNYHPYNDGKSSLRIVNTVENYIRDHGVPEKRKLSLLRRMKINRMFGAERGEEILSQETAKFTAIVPVGNEEHNIEAVLESVSFADEILLVDSYSTDATLELAAKYSPKILQRKYDYPAAQKNWAIPQASYEWILLLDADERVTPELKEEILGVLQNPPQNIAGYWIYRNNHFMGKKVNYSGWRNDKVIRLFRKSMCRYEDKHVHEEIIADGKVGRLQNKLYHNTYVSLDNYIGKLNRYAVWQAKDYDSRTGKITAFHLVIKPMYGFFKHYFLQRGFLDGLPGFTISYLRSYSIFMRYVRLWLLRRGRN